MRFISPASLSFLFVLSACATHTAPVQRSTASASDCPFDDYEPQWKKRLLIYHFYVGQGDSTFVRTPSGTTVLIDAGLPGQSRTAVLPVLQACGIASLDYGVLTHPHIDHFGGWTDLFKAGLPIDKAFLIPSEYDEEGTKSVGRWLNFKTLATDTLKSMGAKKYSLAKLGAKQIVDQGGDVVFDIVASNCTTVGGRDKSCFQPGEPTETVDDNSISIAQVIHYKHFAYWAGGDLTGGGSGRKTKKPDLESLVATQVDHVDVYHANHHGSDTSSNSEFLAALHPHFAVVSAGIGGTNGNSKLMGKAGDSRTAFHLPDEGALIRMGDNGVDAIYMTSRGETEDFDAGKAIDITKDHNIKAHIVDNKENDVLLSTDGATYSFHGKNIASPYDRNNSATSKSY